MGYGIFAPVTINKGDEAHGLFIQTNDNGSFYSIVYFAPSSQSKIWTIQGEFTGTTILGQDVSDMIVPGGTRFVWITSPDASDDDETSLEANEMIRFVRKFWRKSNTIANKGGNPIFDCKPKTVGLDYGWIIPRIRLDKYFANTVDVSEGEKNYNLFRQLVYNDPDYIQWSAGYCRENDIKPRKSKLTKTCVLQAGDSWWNWKCGNKSDTGCKDKTKHMFLCDSLHYVYVLYSRHKKRDNLKKKC